LDKTPDDRPRIGREKFDQVVRTSILDSVRIIGDDYPKLVLSFLESRTGTQGLDPQRLHDVDIALDSLFLQFSTAIKYVIVFQICAALKLEPQKLRKNLEWTVQELRSSCW
jgi:hypothetical protein